VGVGVLVVAAGGVVVAAAVAVVVAVAVAVVRRHPHLIVVTKD
jgi:hypothetical protein